MKFFTLLILLIGIVTFGSAQSAPGAITTVIKPCTATCTPALLPACIQNTIAKFNDKHYVSGSGSGGTSVGAVWYFYNIATDNSVPLSPVQVNASITIDAIYHASIIDFDNNNATDQNGNSLPDLFAPTISADQKLSNVSRSGYAQFTFHFYKNTLSGAGNKFTSANYTQPISLSGLNYVHYDIDGISANDYELRETGLIKQITGTNPVINVNANSELNTYNYGGDGSTWRGFVGSTCNRANTSNCAEVVAGIRFNGAFQSITIRMGYNYLRLNGNGLNAQPGRLYASTFGCFNFPQQILLPVNLASFAGTYHNLLATLNWETQNDMHLDKFEIERSTDGINYATVAVKFAIHDINNHAMYQFADDLSPFSEATFFYRLKMIDVDGKFGYSTIVVIHKEQEWNSRMRIIPDPVVSGHTFSTEFSSKDNSMAYCRIVDFSGRTLYKQQNKVSPGKNSILMPVPVNLQTGVYMLQMSNQTTVETTKFTVVH